MHLSSWLTYPEVSLKLEARNIESLDPGLTFESVLDLKCKWAEMLRSLPLPGDLIQNKEESGQSSSWQLVWAPLYLIKNTCRVHSRAVAQGASQQPTWQVPLLPWSHHSPCPGTTGGLCTAEAGWDVKHSTGHHRTVALVRRWWVSTTPALITQSLLKSLFHQPQCLNLPVGGFFPSSRLLQSYYSVLSNSIKSQNIC